MKFIFLLLWICTISISDVFGKEHLEKGTCNSTITCSSFENECCYNDFCCKKQVNDTDTNLELCKLCPESNSCCTKGRCCNQHNPTPIRTFLNSDGFRRLVPPFILIVLCTSCFLYRRRQRQDVIEFAGPNIYAISTYIPPNSNLNQPPSYSANQQLFAGKTSFQDTQTGTQQPPYPRQEYSSVPPPLSNPPPYSF